MISKKIMYSFKIEKELIEKTRKEAKKHSMATSTYIRQAILEKINYKNKFEEIEKRLDKLEDKNNLYKNMPS